MNTLVKQLVSKMGLYDEPNVLEKTTELMRLLELRSINVPLQINEYGKIVLCADIAAVLLGIAFDKEQALKLSGLRKTQYANNKRMFEKLLDLNKIVGVNDICIQLGLNEVSKKANELLELYKKIIAKENADIDISHPQYAAIAVFQACKILKKKPPKTKLMPFSNLRPTQWMQLEQRWDQFVAKQYNGTMNNKLKILHNEESNIEKLGKQDNGSLKRNKLATEDYEIWKNRMLTMAKTKLKTQHELNKTENMI